MLFSAIMFSCNVLNVNSLQCASMNNQKCKIRTKIIDINNNEPTFYPFSISVNKCSGSCNNINIPYARLCFPDIIKNINVRVFNLMSRTNETRHIKLHQSCRYVCRLDVSVCNNKQSWNKDKCRCECRELIDKDRCDKRFIFTPSNCECECDKLCDVGEYLDNKNCKCRKKIVDKLAEESSEIIDGNKIIYNRTLNAIPLNDFKKVCSSCTIYVVLFVIFLIISTIISSAFICFHWYLKRSNTNTVTNVTVNTETVIY